MVPKQIKAVSKSKRKIEVYAGVDFKDTIDFCFEEVMSLLSKGISIDDILFLYRRSNMFLPYKDKFKKHNIAIKGKTIHSAKGLESSIVFIIGMTEGNGGFPDIWMEDRIYQLIRPVKYDLLLEEERRLFYVAITRAKNHLYLITTLGNESSFLREIPEEFKVVYSTPLKNIEDIFKCKDCKKTIEKHFPFCPFCGGKL